ncbi:hypothetical protein MIR68_004404 [Amoeboaphelidium protococcarum]|nr:hypothetical protein MIR68_004404 [Amoeboaphelidium protococcarum]
MEIINDIGIYGVFHLQALNLKLFPSNPMEYLLLNNSSLQRAYEELQVEHQTKKSLGYSLLDDALIVRLITKVLQAKKKENDIEYLHSLLMTKLKPIFVPILECLRGSGFELDSVTSKQLRDSVIDRVQSVLLDSVASYSPFVQYQAPNALSRIKIKEDQAMDDGRKYVMNADERVIWDSLVCNSNKLSTGSDISAVDYLNTLCIKSVQYLDEDVSVPCCSEHQTLRDGDGKLTDYIRDLVDNAQQGCKSCEYSQFMHVISYAHNDLCVNIKLQRIGVNKSSDQSTDQIVTWTQCQQCETQTSKQCLGAIQISLRKYLELLIYDGTFIPQQQMFCTPPLNKMVVSEQNQQSTVQSFQLLDKLSKYGQQEVEELKSQLKTLFLRGGCPQHQSDIVQCFELSGYRISVQLEKLQLYDIRLPLRALSYNCASITQSLSPLEQPYDIASELWTHVWSYLKQLMKHLENCPTRSKLVQKYACLFADKLRQEESALNDLSAQIIREQLKCEQYLQSMKSLNRASNLVNQPRESVVSLKAVLSSPTIMLRQLKKSLSDKISSIQREVADFAQSINDEYQQLQIPLPMDVNSLSLVKSLKKQFQFDPTNAFTIFASVVQSFEVQELMEILEEVEDLVSLACTSSTDLDARCSMMQQILVDALYPQKISAQYENYEVIASIVEGRHIQVEVRMRASSYCEQSSRRLSVKNRADSKQSDELHSESSYICSWRVTVYYALQFAKLRKLLQLQESDYVESVSSSLSTQFSGGKSASKFYKSVDDSIVLKQVGVKQKWSLPGGSGGSPDSLSSSKGSQDQAAKSESEGEKKMILRMLPKYLDYMVGRIFVQADVLDGSGNFLQEPSMITKTLGVFQVSKMSPVNGVWTLENRQFFISMENIFKGQQVLQKYDLKGILIRQREQQLQQSDQVGDADDYELQSVFKLYAEKPLSTSPNDLNQSKKSMTLWDGNWLQDMYSKESDCRGLLIYPHANVILQRVLRNDIEFLKESGIIDYSLIAGIVQDTDGTQSLVLGIVDYYCEYNFWKMLESGGKIAAKLIQNALPSPAKSQSSPRKNGDQSLSLSERLKALLNTGQQVTPTLDGDAQARLNTQERKQKISTYSSTSFYEEAASSVTVSSPQKYAERFVRAMDVYFLCSPDNWDRVNC